MDPRLVLRLVRRPLWLAGGVSDLAGTGLQALALGLGALAVVEPLLATALLLSVPLEAALDRRRPRGRELGAVALAAAGLAAFLLIANPAGGIPEPAGPAWGWTGAAVGSLVAGCLLAARRSSGTRRAAFLGLAAGTMNGATAGLLKTCADDLAADPLALLTGWHLYLLLMVGGLSFVLVQNAFQGGPLAAPLTALTLADPVAGVVIGVTAFHEHLSAGGPGRIALAAAAVAMARGIWLTSGMQPVRAERPVEVPPPRFGGAPRRLAGAPGPVESAAAVTRAAERPIPTTVG
jgi:hypothetical protein